MPVPEHWQHRRQLGDFAVYRVRTMFAVVQGTTLLSLHASEGSASKNCLRAFYRTIDDGNRQRVGC